MERPLDADQSVDAGNGQPSNAVASFNVQVSDVEMAPNVQVPDLKMSMSAQMTPLPHANPDVQKASDNDIGPNEFFFGPDDLERHRQLRRWLDARSATPSTWGLSDGTSTGNVSHLGNG